MSYSHFFIKCVRYRQITPSPILETLPFNGSASGWFNRSYPFRESVKGKSKPVPSIQ